MDAVSYSHSAKQAKRIKKFIENPDSTSGVLTVPKTIAAGETITIPAGRVAILPDLQVDGDLVVDGDLFIPTGSMTSQVVQKVTSTDNAVVRFDGTTGQVQNSGVIIDDNGNVGISVTPNGTSKFMVYSGSVGQTLGSGLTGISKKTVIDTNASFLNFFTYRTTAGGGHSGTEERIQKIIDATSMGYISFGDNNVKLGNGYGDKVIIDGPGNVGIGTSSPTTSDGKVLHLSNQLNDGTIASNSKLIIESNRNSGIQFKAGGLAGITLTDLSNTVKMQINVGQDGTFLQINGNGIGYGTGAGGIVTQLTSKSTAVTLNKPCGHINMNNAALAAGASVLFAFYNSTHNIDYDQLIVNMHNVVSGHSNYRVENAGSIGGGGVMLRLTNISGASLSESPSIKFTVIKGANA